MFKPKRIKCSVCRNRNSFIFEKGYCEEIDGKWITIKKDNGYCKCGFRYYESNISLEEQARKYKIKVIEKLVLKIKKHKNKKEVKSL